MVYQYEPIPTKEKLKLSKEDAEKEKKKVTALKLPTNLQKYLKNFNSDILNEIIQRYFQNFKNHYRARDYYQKRNEFMNNHQIVQNELDESARDNFKRSDTSHNRLLFELTYS